MVYCTHVCFIGWAMNWLSCGLQLWCLVLRLLGIVTSQLVFYMQLSLEEGFLLNLSVWLRDPSNLVYPLVGVIHSIFVTKKRPDEDHASSSPRKNLRDLKSLSRNLSLSMFFVGFGWEEYLLLWLLYHQYKQVMLESCHFNFL